MKDTIIFDLGRVLVDFELKAYIESLPYEQQVKEELVHKVFLGDNWNEIDRGILSDEELLKRFTDTCPQHHKEIQEVFRSFPTIIKKKSYTDSWVQELKERGYKLYYLSNYGKTAHEAAGETLDFLKWMDGGMMSYQVQRIKPDPEFYRMLFQKYQIHPDKAVFIDDNKSNIEAGAKLGLETILFTDYESGRRELEDIIYRL